MKAIVAGWFSYSNGHATAGDLLACDLLCDWLDEWGMPFEIAVAPPFRNGTSLESLKPAEFSHAFFVCGPFGKGELEGDFLRRFEHCRLIGVNLSAKLPPPLWNPFDCLIERDSSETTRADMVFAVRQPLTPVGGICLLESNPEVHVDRANAAIAALASRHEIAWINIDTRLDQNASGLRTKGEIEAVIARMDVLITTRLHGLVLALKNGVPVVAIDAVPGGGKITRQCARIGWPTVFSAEALDEAVLDDALRSVLTPEARALASRCAEVARLDVIDLQERLAAALAPGGPVERNHVSRHTPAGRDRFAANLPAPLAYADSGGFSLRGLVDLVRRSLKGDSAGGS